MKPLADIPNEHGFRLVVSVKGKGEFPAIVHRDKTTGHHSLGTPKGNKFLLEHACQWSDLEGWHK